MHTRLISGTALLIALILPLSACSLSPEEKKEKHRARGITYFEQGKFQEAILEFRNIIQIDPADANGHYRLALAYLKLSGVPNLQSAFGELMKTVELDSKNQDAHLKLGQLYLLGRQPDKAKEQAELVLASAPQNTQGLYLHAESLIHEKELEKGIEELKQALALEPKNLDIHIALARAYLMAKKPAEAEESLKQAQLAEPRSTKPVLAYGDFLVVQNRMDEAEAAYKKAAELAPEDESLYLKLALFYDSINKWQQAEGALRHLAERRPKDDQPQILLGNFYSLSGVRDKALASYRHAYELKPDSAMARDKLIDYYLELGNIEDAEKLVTPLLEKNKKDFSARFFDARLKLSRGKGDEAIEMLQQLLKEEPKSPQVHYYLGIGYIGKGDMAQARGELTEAVNLAPTFLQGRLSLAALYLDERSPDLAIEHAQAALRINKRSARAAAMLGEALIQKGDLAQAKRVFEAISHSAPADGFSRYRLGLIARSEKDNKKALTYFEEALSISPESVEPLSHVVSILYSEGKVKEARERIMRQMERAPRNALLQNLLGRLAMVTKNYEEAESAFKQAATLNPELTVTYGNLGTLYFITGKQDQALREYEQLLAKDPKALPAYVLVGMMYENKKDYAKAKAQYQAALKLNDRFAPAANNLAWLLAEYDNNLDEALSLAQSARGAAPGDPNVADTLGWIYYKKDFYLKAESLLKEAVEKLPDNPIVHYHYGMVLHKNGNAAGAKKSLQTALKLNKTFPGSQDAERLLKELS